MPTSIHQEVTFTASPQRVYDALVDGAQHGRFTGAPAEIAAEPGGAFSVYGGGVVGRTLELEPGRRIVQAWRAGNWPAGLYTIVRIELKDEAGGTRLVLDHTGVPEDMHGHLEGGWQQMYWAPLHKALA